MSEDERYTSPPAHIYRGSQVGGSNPAKLAGRDNGGVTCINGHVLDDLFPGGYGSVLSNCPICNPSGGGVSCKMIGVVKHQLDSKRK